MSLKALLTASCAASCILVAGQAFAQPNGGEVEMISADSLPNHTIYKPVEAGAALPLVVWGNGSCMVQGNAYAAFLSEVASHGYFVVSIGTVMSDEEAQALVDAQPADPWEREPYSSEADMLAVLDWAEAQQADAASAFHGAIDNDAIAMLGHSCGGIQALGGSRDPRVDTAIGLNTGTFPEGSPALVGGDLTKETLPDLHGPVAYITGDPEDIAFENASDDFDAINHVPVVWAYPAGVGHGGTYDEPNGGEYAEVVRAWLDWHLKGDMAASEWFVGDECRLCTDERWTFSSKGL